MSTKLFTLHEKYQNAAHTLNRQAYERQVSELHGRKFKQFIPCEKATVFIRACDAVKPEVTSVIVHRAALVFCNCHHDLSESELENMLYDDTAKRKHYGE